MRKGYTKLQPKKTDSTRINDYIRVPEVQVIDTNGTQLGILPTPEALSRAQAVELDLVEVAPNAKPPVVRIMDYGKYLYQKEKASKQTKSPINEVKTVRITFRAGEHDLGVRVKQTEGFLQKGNRVKIELKLRGREKAYGMRDLVQKKMNEFIAKIQTQHIIEQSGKRSPVGDIVMLTPSKK